MDWLSIPEYTTPLCLAAESTERSTVAFRDDTVVGCSLALSLDNFTDCAAIRQQVIPPF